MQQCLTTDQLDHYFSRFQERSIKKIKLCVKKKHAYCRVINGKRSKKHMRSHTYGKGCRGRRIKARRIRSA